MFVNEYEKMHWIANEQRTRLLQEARIQRMLGQRVQPNPLSTLAAAFERWLNLSAAIRLVTLRRPLANA
ncbi:MAG: hypothetical protein ACOYNY_42775 [Caldilineaceae bacterium]|jgi:hypothetical protein